MADNNIANMSGIFSQGTPAQSTLGPGGGSNQYMNYPMPGQAGSVPTPPSLPGSSPTSNPNNLNYIVGAPGSANEVPNTNSQHLVPTYDPAYTQQYYNMLMSQLGTGLPGFNLQTQLPGGGTTGAGQLNAPLNSTLTDLQSFLAGGPSNTPGATQLSQMAQTGNPIDQTPAWQAMVASEQQNTVQNANNLREQFASSGDLNSSPFGSAMQQFYNQNTMNQNAQLTQATATAQENAQNRMLSTDQGLQSEAQQFGSGLQNTQQQAIQNMLNEFNYTLPQNNPMNNMFASAATASPSTVGAPKQTFMSQMSQIEGLINGLF